MSMAARWQSGTRSERQALAYWARWSWKCSGAARNTGQPVSAAGPDRARPQSSAAHEVAMDTTLAPDQREILALVREFAEAEVRPRAADIDAKAEYQADLVEQMAELGLMGVPFPEAYGGSGQDYVTFALIVKELCRACASTGLIMDVNISLCGEPILAFGTEEQKRKYLTPLATGERLGALAMTEPEAGSDAASIQTSAVRDGNGYVLNG